MRKYVSIMMNEVPSSVLSMYTGETKLPLVIDFTRYSGILLDDGSWDMESVYIDTDNSTQVMNANIVNAVNNGIRNLYMREPYGRVNDIVTKYADYIDTVYIIRRSFRY